MKIVHVGPIDAAGVGWNLSEAVNEFTPHECYAVFTQPFINAHCTVIERAESLMRRADVIVLHIGYEKELQHPLIGDLCTKDRTVAFFNGSTYLRKNIKLYADKYAGWAKAATNTDIVDMLDCEFVPAPVVRELDRGEWRHSPPPVGERLFVMQTYTDPRVKNTAELTKAANKFPDDWRLSLRKGLRHADCIAVRDEAHILFDHMQGYYGVCAVEAWAAGMPCITGIDEQALGMLREWGAAVPPWRHATDTDSLIELFRGLAKTPWELVMSRRDMRATYEATFNNRIKANRFTEWLEAA